jgi:hypothetical protein
MLSRKIFLCRLAPPLPRPFPPEATKRRGEISNWRPGGMLGEGRQRTFSSTGHCRCVVCGGGGWMGRVRGKVKVEKRVRLWW